jgi:hypothetical protein
MSRYTNDLKTAKSADEVTGTVSSFLTGEGFREQDYGEERVWTKGSGWVTAKQFVKVTSENGNVHLEAWTKALIGGELGLDGVVAAVPKKQLKKRVVHLEQLLGQ